ncbi:solute carrier family 22 member 6-B-like [Bufo gargarizans]|uniref:solute carrier family 22 member 6-B-like n=1 Tax=Bufo gargarizans TaxID=30331 RepID=UPI001CF1380C|nr:solute carrier family 22 member 6-B-like [Bufo gargarizans]
MDFETKDLGDVKHFLGMQIEREEDGSFLINQSHKIQEVNETFGLNDAKPVNSPMETNYLKELNNSINPLQNDSQFIRAMGKLLYIATVARPDIAIAVGFLCSKVSQPTQMDWNAAKRIIRYLKGTIDFKLKLSSTGKSGLTGYVDADWAGDPSDRKSTSGHLFLFKDGLSSWTTRKQSTVTRSSTEAEYVATSQAGQEVIWLRQLLEDLDQNQTESTPIYEDNQGCIALAQTERINLRTKHIDTIKYDMQREINASRGSSYSVLDLIRTPVLRRISFCICCTWFSTSFAYYGLAMDLQKFGLSIYIVQIIFGTVDIPAKFFSYFVITHMGRRVLQAASLILAGIAILVNVFVPEEFQTVRTSMAVFGKGCLAASFNCVFLYTGELYPTVIRQSGMGLGTMMARLGGIVAPLVQMTADFYIHLPLIIYSLCPIFSGIASCFLPETLGVPLPETIQEVESPTYRKKVSKYKEEISLKDGI